jgi:copper resistance protein B
MNRLLILLLASAFATPAFAQHAGHNMPATPAANAPAQADPHAGHQMTAQTPPADPHAGHQMPPPAPAAPATADSHAGHTMPAQPPQSPPSTAADPHQGHDMGATPQSADPHAGHQMGTATMESAAPPVAPPPPEALSGPAHAAELVYDRTEVANAREELRVEHGGMNSHRFLIDRLELVSRDGANGYAWDDVQFWYGGDLNKLWLKSQGEGTFGQGVDSAEVQALWSRAIAPFWDLQAGVRHDFEPHPTRNHLLLGIQGLAPYWFEIDAAAFLSEEGDVTARFEGEYDLRITQRLILQPQTELDFSLQDVSELNIGSGLSTAEAGLRLRYEIVPEFAPYVGVRYERAFGDTADFRRADGENVGGWSLVLGVRTWF